MAIAPNFDASGRGTPGQLRDGAAIGIVRAADNGTVGTASAFGWNLRARFYRGLLIIEVLQYSANSTLLDNQGWGIRSREFFANSREMNVAFGTAGINLIATKAQLEAIGLTDGNLVPVAPSNDEMPFELTADLKIQKKDLPLSDVEFVNQITQANLQTALVGAAAGTGSGTGSGTVSTVGGMNVNWANVIKVALVIGVVVVVYKVGKNMDWF